LQSHAGESPPHLVGAAFCRPSLPSATNPETHEPPPCLAPALFGINQGGTFADLRVAHMKQISELDLPGYAIGGLAVGESTAEMYDTIDVVEPHMPFHKPRYLMGVGTPSNLIEAVSRGIDFFDCVMPARNGRHGKLYVWGEEGSININNERFRADDSPIDGACECQVCANFSRAYMRHLFKSDEMLGKRFAVMHNLFFYNTLMERIRDCIDSGAVPSRSLLMG
ncbi:MAG: tRNA-guanine transglycosylase, partial [Oscillospiraceae bacterium]|nr:tRNA-guanine transglycosylase [Oscillospiraceae bacterium]